ncbi:MAG TPA: Fe-S protein assembly co-chaperone HscB [Polyangia bacterium]|jgi:molecular chaperone HscB
MTCWKCHSDASAPICQACGALQPLPPGLDHFAALGVPRRFDLDRRELETRHRELSRLVHPDRFATADGRERRLSLLWATAVNDALKLLRDPWRRAEYLLQLGGVDVGDERGGQRHVPPAFLMQTLEMREALAEATAAGDAARVGAMRADVEARRAALLAQVGELFAAAAADRAPLATALAQNRYYARFLDEIDAFHERENR